MGEKIERNFLVSGDAWRKGAQGTSIGKNPLLLLTIVLSLCVWQDKREEGS